MNNYHWYMKQHLDFGSSVTGFNWDIEKPYVAHFVTEGTCCYLQYSNQIRSLTYILYIYRRTLSPMCIHSRYRHKYLYIARELRLCCRH